jgi:plastocyanin
MKKVNGSNRRLFTGVVILFSVFSIMNSCKKPYDSMYTTGTTTGSTTGTTGSSSGPGANEVWIQGMAFSPATITVATGTTITWTNKDAVAHNVTSTTSLFNSPSIGTNGTYSHLFPTAGTYNYYCTVHPSMTATVIVN